MLDLSAIEDEWLDHRFKGYPPSADPVRVRDSGRRGWRLLADELPFPVAVLRQSALDHNERWMRDFCAATRVSLAPHGKTTMAPQLFARQLAAGAWGITLATVQQVQVAVDAGVRRIVVANQIVGRADLARLCELLVLHGDLTLHFLVDSVDGLERAEAAAHEAIGLAGERPVRQRPLQLSALVEIGYPGGRTGVRTRDEALVLARRIAASAHVRLAGIECYEGLRLSADAAADARTASDLVADAVAVARAADEEGLFGADELILSAGGSALFDVVAREMHAALSKPVRSMLRSGCYVTHDSGSYALREPSLRARLGPEWQQREGFRHALEVWGQVQSRPEADLAILGFGRRDVGFDSGLPTPLWQFRAGRDRTPVPATEGLEVVGLNDQHAYLRGAASNRLAVGDLVGCGISHPCTTFDKWRLLWVVDDDYRVVGAIRTYF